MLAQYEHNNVAVGLEMFMPLGLQSYHVAFLSPLLHFNLVVD